MNSQAGQGQQHYTLKLTETDDGTGYFSCVPAEPVEIAAAFDYLRGHPMDTFMHQFLLACLGSWSTARMETALAETPAEDRVLRALLAEACMTDERFRSLRSRFCPEELQALSDCSPLILLRSIRMPDRDVHNRWIALFGANIGAHQPLPPPDAADTPPADAIGSVPKIQQNDLIGIDQIPAPTDTAAPLQRPPAPQQTFARAARALADAGIRLGPEMRHASVLSPVALLRQWQMAVDVTHGRHRYILDGVQTAYGRGLDLQTARAACAMEIIERCSAFAGADAAGIRGTATRYRLELATFSALEKEQTAVLDPNDLLLEVPYENAPLVWLTAQMLTAQGTEPVRIPAQCVFLFANFDETGLFSGLGSTGLASGNSLSEAKYHGLLELIERETAATVTYRTEQCFTIRAEDPHVAALLSDYRKKGIGVQFQRLDAGLGVPCYKCFVIAGNGAIVKGTAAHLSGQRALLSAMTETPYPLAGAPPSRPCLDNLPQIAYESLPDYSTGDPGRDLARLEGLMLANGFSPIYVDLTRQDMGIPVARAMVPKMALTADFDSYARVHPRLFAHYVKHHRTP